MQRLVLQAVQQLVLTGVDFRSDRVGAALAGTNPTVLRRLSAGFAVIGDVQHLAG